MYVQTVRRSIYKTRQTEHFHLKIRGYKLRPQGPPARPRYTESCLNMAYYTLHLCLCLRPRASLSPSQSLQELYRFIKSSPIVASGLQQYQHHRHPRFCSGTCFRLDSTHLFLTWFDPPVLDLIRLTYFWLDLTHLFLTSFDSHTFNLIQFNCCSIWLNQLFFDLIRITCFLIWSDLPVFWFDSTRFFYLIIINCFSIWLDSIGVWFD